MALISGIHHVAVKCKDGEQYAKALSFYKDLLGLTIYRQWETGTMLDTGDGIVEVLMTGEDSHTDGVIRHIAFLVNDPDACADAVRKAGYEVFIEPCDVTIKCDEPLSLRVAFCKGPLGEEVEFYSNR